MDQDVYLFSLCKLQPQGYFDAKMPAVADDDTDVQGAGDLDLVLVCHVLFEALDICYAMFPPSKKRGRGLLAAGPRVSVGGAPLDDPEDEKPACGAGAR